jgi:hypothetical protein
MPRAKKNTLAYSFIKDKALYSSSLKNASRFLNNLKPKVLELSVSHFDENKKLTKLEK